MASLNTNALQIINTTAFSGVTRENQGEDVGGCEPLPGDTIQGLLPNERRNISAAEFTRALDKRLRGKAERV